MRKQSTPSADRYVIRCLNGLKHGSSARKLLLPDENPGEFYALLHEAFEHQPNTRRDAHFVADLAQARWFLLRRERAYTYYEQSLHLKKPQAESWNREEQHQLQLLNRYKVEAQRAVQRALLNLRYFDKDGRRIRNWQDLHTEFRDTLLPIRHRRGPAHRGLNHSVFSITGVNKNLKVFYPHQ